MPEDQEYVEPKGHYSTISYKKRLKLIEMTLSKGYSIYRAAKQLNISNSTAKLIIKNYREEGHIFQKKRLAATTTAEPEVKLEEKIEQDNKLSIQQAREQFFRVLNEMIALNNLWVELFMHP